MSAQYYQHSLPEQDDLWHQNSSMDTMKEEADCLQELIDVALSFEFPTKVPASRRSTSCWGAKRLGRA